MAKVIRATPTLIGKEAIAFLERMKKNNYARPSKVDKELLTIIRENEKLFASV